MRSIVSAWLALWGVLMLTSAMPVGAAPAPSPSVSATVEEERPQYWPYHSLERRAASSRQLELNTRGVVILTFHDAESFRRFWVRAHYFRDSFEAAVPTPRPPKIDFEQRMVIAVIGRAGSASVKVQKMWTLPQQQLVAGIFNPYWPDVPMTPDRVPYELVVARSTPRHVLHFEREAAVALARLTQAALEPLRLPLARGRELTAQRLTELRATLAARGTVLLAACEKLPAPRHNDPEEPYVHMLKASILQRYLDRPKDAVHAWREVILLWPSTPPAHLAKSRVLCLERRERDDDAAIVLETARAQLSADGTIDDAAAKRWLDLGQSYEYLTSLSPMSSLLAAGCYLEAAREPHDDDRIQNALLQAASLYELYFDPQIALKLYWQCVSRYPDAQSVPQILKKMALINWELRRPKPDETTWAMFLHRFPRSKHAPMVRRWLEERRKEKESAAAAAQ